MSVVDYYRASHQDKIKLRVAFLTSLRVYQAMREEEARLARKRKLDEIGGSSSGGGGGGGGGDSRNSSAETIEALNLPDNMKQAINIIEGKFESEIKEVRKESIEREEKLRGEMSELKRVNVAQRSEIATLNKKVETLNGIRPVLNGPLANDMITAFELWREILMYL